MLHLAPSAIDDFSKLGFGVDLSVGQTAYTANAAQFIFVQKPTFDGSAFQIELNGVITTQGITTATFDGKVSHSLGVRFDPLEVLQLRKITDYHLQKVLNGGDGWTLKELAGTDTVFLKVKVKKSGLNDFTTNFTPGSLETLVAKDVATLVRFEICFYFNFEENIAGSSLILKALNTNN